MNSNYKIVQLSSVHSVFDTRIFYKISASLLKAGYEVDLLIQHSKNEEINGINVIALPIAKKKLDRLLKILPALFLKAIKYPPKTLFHFHDPELIPIGLLLKLFGYKVIYDVHEDTPNDILDKEWINKSFRGIIARIVKNIEKICVKSLDVVITVTPTIQNKLGSKVSVIQNFPILEEVIEQKDSVKRKFLFYVGNITKVRGIFEIMDALELINQKSDIKLILGGTFGSSNIEKEIRNHTAWKFVIYKEWLTRQEIAEYANKSIVGLVVFHPIKSHIKAQPNKLFEYMMHGLPVVGSDFPLWRNIILQNKCGILIDPLDPKEIVASVKEIADNPSIAELMGKNGKEAVKQRYNWENEEQKLLTLYSNLLKIN